MFLRQVIKISPFNLSHCWAPIIWEGVGNISTFIAECLIYNCTIKCRHCLKARRYKTVWECSRVSVFEVWRYELGSHLLFLLWVRCCLSLFYFFLLVCFTLFQSIPRLLHVLSCPPCACLFLLIFQLPAWISLSLEKPSLTHKYGLILP